MKKRGLGGRDYVQGEVDRMSVGMWEWITKRKETMIAHEGVLLR